MLLCKHTGTALFRATSINNAESFTQASWENESWVIPLRQCIHQVKGPESLITTDVEIAGNIDISGGADHHTTMQFRQVFHLTIFWRMAVN